MKRPYVMCGLCCALVRLTKSGAVPEHPMVGVYGYGPVYVRCNGLRHGIRIAKPVTLNPWQERYWREARRRALRFHQAGKSVERDPAQRRRWLYWQGWLPEQQARRDVNSWQFALKAGRA